jgi:hypothetical protein
MDISKAWGHGKGGGSQSREILIECQAIGNIMRVTAVDTKTGTEISFQAPQNTAKTMIQSLAASKMRYVLEKQKTNK